MKKILLSFALICAYFLSNAQFTLSQDVVIWGNNKSGQFDGGLNDWTAKGIYSDDATKAAKALWTWSADGTAKEGSFWGTRKAIASASVANGAAVFNSDFLDNDGKGGANTGLGTCPAPHIGILTSPVIDLTNEKSGVTLVFNQFYRAFSTLNDDKGNNDPRDDMYSTGVAYSNDGGTTWIDTVYLNKELKVNNQTAENDVQRVNLVGAGGTNKFVMRFIFDGEYYFWIVDDVKLVKQQANDLKVNTDFYSVAPNVSTPKDQVVPINFLADVTNLGGANQSNVKLKMNVVNAATKASVFTDTYDYGTINANSTVENKLLAKQYTPPATVATYTATYEIGNGTAEADSLNNRISFAFGVTDSLFTKEDGSRTTSVGLAASAWNTGNPHAWSMGNVFYVVNGKKHIASTARIAINNPGALAGQTMDAALYKWKNTNNDGLAQDAEKTLVGLGSYTFKSTDVAGLYNITLTNFVNDKLPLELEDTTNYLIMMEYNPSSATAPDLQLIGSYSRDYTATDYAYELKNSKSYATSSLVLVNGSKKDIYSGFTSGVVPIIRLYVKSTLVANEEVVLPANSMKAYPNPTANTVTLDINLDKLSKEVKISLFGLGGNQIDVKELNNIQNDKIQIDLSSIPNGVYMLHVLTDFGYRTQRLVIQK